MLTRHITFLYIISETSNTILSNQRNEIGEGSDETKALVSKQPEEPMEKCDRKKSRNIDNDLNNINFHLMLFFMWMAVAIVNVPALLTWARNFK